MAAESGLSMVFQALGLDNIQQKIATTAKSFKSIDREAAKLSALGSSISRFSKIGGGAGVAGGMLGGVFGQLAAFTASIAVAKALFRQNKSLFSFDAKSNKKQTALLLSVIPQTIKNISRNWKLSAIHLSAPIANFSSAIKNMSIYAGKRIATLANKLVTAIKPMAAGGLGLAKKVTKPVSNIAKVIGTSLISKLLPSFKFIASLSAGITATVAAIALVTAGAYFKIDKMVSSSVKWISTNVLKPTAKFVSDFFTGLKDGFARLTNRGEWISSEINPTQALRRYTPQERSLYEQQVALSLELKDREEAIESQIEELRSMWKELDEKYESDIKKIVEQMRWEARN